MWKSFFRDYGLPVFIVGGIWLANFERHRFPAVIWGALVNGCFILILGLLALSAFLDLRKRIADGGRIFHWKDPFRVALGVLSALLFGTVLTGYLLGGADLGRTAYVWLSDPTVDRRHAAAAVMLLVGASGFVLFWFRLIARACYGAVEVLVGLYVALAQIQNVAPGRPVIQESVLLGLLTAGVYLVVRGLDNVHQGCTSSKPDRIALFFVRLVTRRSV